MCCFVILIRPGWGFDDFMHKQDSTSHILNTSLSCGCICLCVCLSVCMCVCGGGGFGCVCMRAPVCVHSLPFFQLIPKSGTSAGGTVITIVGTNFGLSIDRLMVHIGGKPCTNLRNFSRAGR